MKVDTKLFLILFSLVTAPLATALVLIHEGYGELGELFLSVSAIASFLMLKPLASLLANVIFMRDIKAMNRFCLQVKQGKYNAAWPLPDEQEDEHELLQLKRNLFWMVHAISSREDWLQSRLSETAETKERFERMSYMDGLTGIYNRRFFDERLLELAEQAMNKGESFYLMMLDCDGFKAVNDVFGHQAGDALLVRLAGILQRFTREGVDYPFRYGGDEFGVIFTCVEQDAVMRISERIRERFHDVRVGDSSLSIGVGRFEWAVDAEAAVEELKQRVDLAVYAAKNGGKDRVILAGQRPPEMRAQ
ncbi:diguanylate cyclase domain-containing protein [Desulfovibrio ferrophilus]|uniref:diguanylate cyclase n=1 Tax=Desulfovibrio ferrophilus TaxID=241368 RepID=A0A2Z6AZH2_9BACT|nr:diguanylate cyclase [Desulfovibrio ferrophilus]BBD08590.1 diguanylate cyclase [Desulfovibrio ferrophilus]